jgi:Fe-S cluster biogenesis protein NfuA
MNTTSDESVSQSRAHAPNQSTVRPNGLPQPFAGGRLHGRHIQEIIEQIESLPDIGMRELMLECLRAIFTLYGNGLARMLQLVSNAEERGHELREALINDKLVCDLLLIHGLHPVGLEERLQDALDMLRPYLESHGGNVELIGLHNDVARLRLQGTCQNCSSASVTLELAMRRVIEVACPDLRGFEVEGLTPRSSQPAPGPCLAINE